jgi:hypothetical protein
MDLNITNLLSDTTVGDDVLLDLDEACKALRPKDKPPLSRRALSRDINKSDGLESVEIGGRIYIRVGALRERVRSRIRRPNPRQGGRRARTS